MPLEHLLFFDSDLDQKEFEIFLKLNLQLENLVEIQILSLVSLVVSFVFVDFGLVFEAGEYIFALIYFDYIVEECLDFDIVV